jgi:hypothetical protein
MSNQGCLSMLETQGICKQFVVRMIQYNLEKRRLN